MRSLVFNIAFGLISVFHTFWAALAALAPGRGRVRNVVRRYVRRMVWAMRVIAGIRIEVRGAERLPPGGFILAPKHASYGDGFSIYAQFDDLAFVTGDHLERFPLFKTVLKKLGAIVVDSCGGPEARRALSRSAAEANAEGRRILIYPEGALAPVGVHFRSGPASSTWRGISTCRSFRSRAAWASSGPRRLGPSTPGRRCWNSSIRSRQVFRGVNS
jgi:1-acyl-sn-glycerol-3-phosphate acyltransferase